MTNTAKPSEQAIAQSVREHADGRRFRSPTMRQITAAILQRAAEIDATRPPSSEQAGDWPELPDSFARVCDDGYWLLRVSGTARFTEHDSRYTSAQEVYSADQMCAYGEACIAAPAKPCDAEDLAGAMEFEAKALVLTKGRDENASDVDLLRRGAQTIRRLAQPQRQPTKENEKMELAAASAAFDLRPVNQAHPFFEPIWNAIKGWDVQRIQGVGYAGANGTDVQIIIDAIDAQPQRQGRAAYGSIAHRLYCEVGFCGGDPGCFFAADQATQDRWNAAVEKVMAEQPASAAVAPDLLRWAVDSWHEQVAQRPLENKHRRSLDDVWRQVIRFAGGDDIGLCGPAHDDLLAAARGVAKENENGGR